MPTDKPRTMITLDEETFEMIEDFQHRNRYPNRNMAINALLQIPPNVAEPCILLHFVAVFVYFAHCITIHFQSCSIKTVSTCIKIDL